MTLACLNSSNGSPMHFFVCLVLIYLFLGPHLQCMEVPRLGIELELQLPAYTTATDSNTGSELRLRPAPQLMEMLDP